MWIKGKPTHEGIFYMCYLDPFGSGLAVYGEGAVHADDEVWALGEKVSTVYGWYEFELCPYENKT